MPGYTTVEITVRIKGSKETTKMDISAYKKRNRMGFQKNICSNKTLQKRNCD